MCPLALRHSVCLMVQVKGHPAGVSAPILESGVTAREVALAVMEQ